MNLTSLMTVPRDQSEAAVRVFREAVTAEIEALLNWGRLYTKSAGCPGAISAQEVRRRFEDQKRKVMEILS